MRCDAMKYIVLSDMIDVFMIYVMFMFCDGR